MGIFLLLLCVLWISSVCSFSDGACPRKDPPPGVVVLSPGSRLDLTCSGHVEVNGVKVKNGSSFNKRRTLVGIPPTPNIASNTFSTENDKTSFQNTISEEYPSTTTETGVSSASGENKSLSWTYKEYTTSPNMVRSATASRTPQGESDWEAEEMDTKSDYDNEDGVEGIRATRGVQSRPQWMWNKELVGTGNRDWGKITFTRDGTALSLASVRPADAGNYICHHNGKETFAVKVIVADPPETPSLSCVKKSPSSKIRCEWRPQKPMVRRPNCYLSLKTSNPKFHQIQCSYSSQRCWCAVDNNDNEHRTVHLAFLCVTSIHSNATSPPIYFTPLDILKPDPPSNVSVQVEQRKNMRVTWNLPISWKQKDSFYSITYELKYKPLISLNEQVLMLKRRHSYTITDALPGEEYLIQLRNKEEFDGQWSDWSPPVYATIWTESDLTTTMSGPNILEEIGSGFPDSDYLDDPTTGPACLNASCEPSNVLWIGIICAVLSVILAIYIFRHKNKLMSKLHGRSVTAPHQDLSPPPPQDLGPPEGEVLMVFVPQLPKDCQPNDTQEGGENEEGQTATDRIEAMHFNNKSYFFLEREL